MTGRGDGTALSGIRTLLCVGTSLASTDEQLVRRFVSRGEAAEVAFAALVERHGPMVLRVCRDVLRDPHRAEDAFQATFLILALKAGTIRDRGSVASWLFGVARRVAGRARIRDAMRVRNERRWLAAVEPDEQLATSPIPIPEVHEEVDRLPEKYRAPVVLCYLEGLTHEEAAARLRVPVGTVKVRLSRARERLRGRLTRRGLAPAFALASPVTAPGHLPPSLIRATAAAAMRIAPGHWPEISATVLVLIKGALKAMYLIRLRTATIVVVSSLTLSLTAMLVLPGLARSSPGPESGVRETQDVPEVATETVGRSIFRLTTRPAATIQAYESVEIYPRMAGDLKSLNVDIGDAVKRGQLLAEIDPAEIDAEVEGRRAALEKAQARLVVARSAIRVAEATLAAERSKATATDASVNEVENALHLRQKQAERIKKLVENHAVEAKLEDEVKGQVEIAASAVQAAKAQVVSAAAAVTVAEAKASTARAELDELNADIRIERAGLEKAQIRRNFARIASPMDGIVTKRNSNVGVFLRPSTEGNFAPLLSISNIGKVRAIVGVSSNDAPRLDRGDPATIQIDALGHHQFSGMISRTAYAEDAVSRTLRAEIDLENIDGRLRPGQTGSALIILEEHPHVLTIPSSAIIGSNPDGSATCYRVADGKAIPIKVVLGADDGTRVEVKDGLKEGESVIVAPGKEVVAGTSVHAVEKPQKPR